MKTKMSSPAFQPNHPLARLIEEAQNPYHTLHVAKSFELKKPKTGFSMPDDNPAKGYGNPWTKVGMK